jgi:hypothetical protein
MRFSHESAQARPKEPVCAYNLFRNKQRPEILCAVLEDYPVPSFLGPEQWAFHQALRSADARQPGFNDKAAYAGVRFNDFYLFQATAVFTKATVSSVEAALTPHEPQGLRPVVTEHDRLQPKESSSVRQHVRKRLQRFLDNRLRCINLGRVVRAG